MSHSNLGCEMYWVQHWILIGTVFHYTTVNEPKNHEVSEVHLSNFCGSIINFTHYLTSNWRSFQPLSNTTLSDSKPISLINLHLHQWFLHFNPWVHSSKSKVLVALSAKTWFHIHPTCSTWLINICLRKFCINKKLNIILQLNNFLHIWKFLFDCLLLKKRKNKAK